MIRIRADRKNYGKVSTREGTKMPVDKIELRRWWNQICIEALYSVEQSGCVAVLVAGSVGSRAIGCHYDSHSYHIAGLIPCTRCIIAEAMAKEKSDACKY